MLEKLRGGLEKNKFFFIDFSSKIDWKSIEKSRKTTFAAKIDENALPGTAFLGKCRFLLIFGLPGGTQKLLKIYESFRVKGSWEPSGSHFGRFNAFFWFWLHFWCILAPFWVPRARFLVDFCSFFCFGGETVKHDKNTATQQPNNPTTNWCGPVECAKRLNIM